MRLDFMPHKEGDRDMTKYIPYTDRMKVTVPEGEVDGLRVQKFEVKALGDWTDADEERTDVIAPIVVAQMEVDGRPCKPGWYTRLADYNDLDSNGRPQIWMSDTTAERDDHKDPVARIQMGKAQRVLINGLGLGMVLQAALSYDHVTHVDVVEKDERVIKLIGPHYTSDPRVNIVHADAYEQRYNWSTGPRKRWDVGWSDIWPELIADNIDGMDELHKYYRHRCGWHGMWGRAICLKQRRELRAYGLA
jgi:hypothetical protein